MGLRWPRTLGAVGVALLAWVLMVEGASAHVQIEPATARAGATVPVAFRLENEHPDAATVKVLVQFPRKYPIAEATPENDNTWNAKVTTRKVRAFRGPNGRTTTAVDEVVWEGGPSPKAGEFNLPQITIGPLPKNVKRLYFKVVQTYDNGHVDRWIQLPKSGAPEPDTPAATLRLTKHAS